MPVFAYKAKGADGAVVEGTVDAEEQKAAVARLRDQKLVILEIGEKTAGPLDAVTGLFKRKGKVTNRDLVLFSRQLSTLVGAGVPIVQSLAILENQAENPAFKEVLVTVRSDIESGLSISDALKKHPDAFPELYSSMIKAGELGGILDTILERLTAYLESNEALKAKVKSAMMYPIIVLSICFVITIFLLTFVIPRFATIFQSFGAELPWLTQTLLDISTFVKQPLNFLCIMASPVVGWKILQRVQKTPAGAKYIDAKLLTMPLFGIILKKVAVARFTRTLGTLIKSGVPILQALETVASTAGNVIIGEAVLSARESIREGGHLSDPLKKSGVFPNMVTAMISVGEETGALDAMLAKIADFYDQEVDTAVKGLTSLIEPIVIVVMGAIVGTIVAAMFLPMFGMGELAGNMEGGK
ncbi:MAG: type II secretion system F family protein [Elusimicrobia bacterium]|nr:type II secretion system F family protein [Elusimicrobiota bacterium]